MIAFLYNDYIFLFFYLVLMKSFVILSWRVSCCVGRWRCYPVDFCVGNVWCECAHRTRPHWVGLPELTTTRAVWLCQCGIPVACSQVIPDTCNTPTHYRGQNTPLQLAVTLTALKHLTALTMQFSVISLRDHQELTAKTSLVRGIC